LALQTIKRGTILDKKIEHHNTAEKYRFRLDYVAHSAAR